MRRRNRPGLIRGRAIAPNAGLEAEYQRRLQKLVREMSRSVEYWLSAEYRRQEPRIELYNAPPETVPDRSVPGMPHDPLQAGQVSAESLHSVSTGTLMIWGCLYLPQYGEQDDRGLGLEKASLSWPFRTVKYDGGALSLFGVPSCESKKT